MTQEGPRTARKYLLTLQPGTAEKQLAQMEAARVSFVVPEPLHKYYPEGCPLIPLTVEAFIEEAKRKTE